MTLRTGAATKQRLNALQKQLYEARLADDIDRDVLAEKLQVELRTLRDWERRYDWPSLVHAVSWALALGFRFEVTGHSTSEDLPELDAEAFAQFEMRRLASVLKPLRITQRLSQTDLALIIGVSRSSLLRWEDGPQLARLPALIVWADRLGETIGLSKITNGG